MYTRTMLLLCLLASAIPSDANRHSELFFRSARDASRHLLKRRSELARDLQRAFTGIFDSGGNSDAHQFYCVSGTSLTDGSTDSSGNRHSRSGPNTTSNSESATATASISSPSGSVASSPWKLKQSYQGTSFFDGWTFFTDNDPTGGIVKYVDQSTAQSTNLTSINSAGNAIMRVETTQIVSGNRSSVRITTKYSYTGALIILDSVHMPTGCGTWPAFWSNGPNWPAGGEIDIVEGVNTYTNNQATIHTHVGCMIPSSDSTVLGMTGSLVGLTNCTATPTNDEGCGIRSSLDTSFGPGFNAIGGGVHAMQWDNDGISVWFFPRPEIPSDIAAGAPLPSSWGNPMANWPPTECDPSTFFYQHSAIFDITLCGQWAGSAWFDTGAPGQSESCAQITGTASCTDYVQNNGATFTEAYWEVKSVRIYQTN